MSSEQGPDWLARTLQLAEPDHAYDQFLKFMDWDKVVETERHYPRWWHENGKLDEEVARKIEENETVRTNEDTTSVATPEFMPKDLARDIQVTTSGLTPVRVLEPHGVAEYSQHTSKPLPDDLQDIGDPDDNTHFPEDAVAAHTYNSSEDADGVSDELYPSTVAFNTSINASDVCSIHNQRFCSCTQLPIQPTFEAPTAVSGNPVSSQLCPIHNVASCICNIDATMRTVRSAESSVDTYICPLHRKRYCTCDFATDPANFLPRIGTLATIQSGSDGPAYNGSLVPRLCSIHNRLYCMCTNRILPGAEDGRPISGKALDPPYNQYPQQQIHQSISHAPSYQATSSLEPQPRKITPVSQKGSRTLTTTQTSTSSRQDSSPHTPFHQTRSSDSPSHSRHSSRGHSAASQTSPTPSIPGQPAKKSSLNNLLQSAAHATPTTSPNSRSSPTSFLQNGLSQLQNLSSPPRSSAPAVKRSSVAETMMNPPAPGFKGLARNKAWK
ncbi:hypothetical protein EJ08DRAFT_316142 [Tothia fuscella]|uniref:Uncharacterized protein n=1 Tax=Tothia fuscella TaxID=1048955 RepID=A0A9P4NMV2_9PEZI|nr:hypothetical protein EJ08DRAFT_316142 [Tothia fuscella]